MNDKYYTPLIEEFHVGFEFEFSDYISSPEESSEWYKGNFGSNTAHIFDQESWEFHLKDQINKGHVRVKYLDKEDIESLGFEQFEYNGYRIKKSKNFLNNHSELLDYNEYIELYINDNNKLEIIWQPKYLFNGEIKNKSELKKLLKMLYINE